MSEMPSCEAIVNELRDEALKYPDTGWLSDLARRDLTWDGQNEVIIIGSWYGSVDVGHLAAIVESLIDKKTQDLTTRLEQAEQRAEQTVADYEAAEQAVQRVREALTEVQTRGEKIRAKGNNGSIYQQERAARGEGYLEATRLAFRALDGDTRG